MNAEELLKHATGFEFGSREDPPHLLISVRDRANDRWAIVEEAQEGRVLTRAGNWCYEHSPSSRSPSFKARTRFTLEEATEIVTRKRKKSVASTRGPSFGPSALRLEGRCCNCGGTLDTAGRCGECGHP